MVTEDPPALHTEAAAGQQTREEMGARGAQAGRAAVPSAQPGRPL